MSSNEMDAESYVDAGYQFKVNEGNTYNQYDLQSFNIFDNGQNTGDQIIRYNNQHIKTLRQSYNVVPHEELLGLVKVVADEMGLDNIQSSTKVTNPNAQMWGHKAKFGDATISRDGKYMAASFISDEVKIGDVDKNHNIFGGVTVLSSIDGTSSIRVMPLTLRTFCMNIMNHVMAEFGMKEGLLGESQHQLNKLKRMTGEHFDHGRSIKNLQEGVNTAAAKARFYHRQNLDMDIIAESIKMALEHSQKMLGEYQKLQDLMLEQKMAMELVATLPAAAIKSAQFLHVEKDEVKIVNPNITLYEVMNHFTQYLTYYSNSKSMRAVYRKYGEVDKIFFNEDKRTELLKPIQVQ